MKKSAKFFSALLCGVLAFCSLTACRGDDGGRQIDETKTQLNIGVWPGAYGDGIASETIRRFEEKYKDVSFENGKTGVQVVVNKSANYKASAMTNFQNYNEDMYVLEESTYYDSIRDGQGDFLELTDVVNSSLRYDFVRKQTAETGENKKFSDKLYQADLDWMNVGTEEAPKYYAVPYRQEYAGIWYDVDMFDQRNYYFRTNAADSPFITNPNDTKSPGADGKTGTWDDGLPATYDQFITLCKRIREAGSAPIIWTGQYIDQYGNDFLRSLYSDYSGLDEMMTTVNLAGKHDIVTGFDQNDDPIIEKQDLTYNDAYKAHESSAGKYYAMKFAEELCTTTASNGKNLYLKNSDLSHYQAQLQFLANKYDNNDDCAMILEWSYWFCEAKSNVNSLKDKYKLTDDDFNYALMPFPKATEEKIGEGTTVMCGDSMFVVSRYIAPEKTDLAKAFVQFIANEETLRDFFNEYTVMLKYKMDIDRESDFYKNASTLGKSVLDASERMDFFIPLKSTTEYRKLAGSLAPRYNAFGGISVFTEFTRTDNVKTAKELFESMKGKYEIAFR